MIVIFNIIGCFAAWSYGLFPLVSPELQLLFTTYLLSVLLLSAVNKLLKVRASGRACSTIAPVFFAGYFLGPGWALLYIYIGALLNMALVWCPQVIKRAWKICHASFLNLSLKRSEIET